MKGTKGILVCLLVIAVITLMCSVFSFPGASERHAKQRLVISVDTGGLSSLVFIAKSRGYFAQQGIEVELTQCETGIEAIDALEAGKVDLASAAEFVAAHCILKGTDVQIVTSLCETDNVKLVARKDRGITHLSDIQSKRIGLARHSVAEFYLHLLAVLHEIPLQSIQMVNLTPSAQLNAISEGKIDALIVWEPQASQTIKALGTNCINWSAQSGQDYYWLLLAKKSTISERPDAMSTVVSGLISAEKFIKDHREDAKTVVAGLLGAAQIEAIWQGSRFRIGLDRSLAALIETQMRWIKGPPSGGSKSDIPDVLDFIHFDTLKSVRPDRVKMFH